MELRLNEYLPWDGSSLGLVSKDDILLQWLALNRKYVKIMLQSGVLFALISPYNSLTLIADRLKPLFGLSRNGLHSISVQGKRHLLSYVRFNEKDQILSETSLSELDLSHPYRSLPSIQEEVCRNLVFRDILCISNSNESSLRLRQKRDSYEIISVNELSLSSVKDHAYDQSVISDTLYLRWFGEKRTAFSLLQATFSFSSDEELPRIVAVVRKQLEEIVKEIDPTYLWWIQVVINRFLRALISGEKKN